MKKLYAIVSDFDNTLFLTNEAISNTINYIKENFRSSKQKINEVISELKYIITNGATPKNLDQKFRGEIYKLAYDIYSKSLLPNEPVMAYILSKIENIDLIVLSYRTEFLRKETESLLNAYGLRYKQLILLPDQSLIEKEWKLNELIKIARNYNHVNLFEDREENIRYFMHESNYKNIKYYLVKNGKIEAYQNNRI